MKNINTKAIDGNHSGVVRWVGQLRQPTYIRNTAMTDTTFETALKTKADLQKYMAEKKKRDAALGAAQTVVSPLSSLCNSSQHRDLSKALSAVIQTDHRTLQASMIRTLLEVIIDYADARHDLRNEAAVKECQKVKEALDGLAVIPFI